MCVIHNKMKRLSLRPYPGTLLVCFTPEDFRRQHKKAFGVPADPLGDAVGRMVGRYIDEEKWPTYLVYSSSLPVLAHELSHVILHLFEQVGIDPREAQGEPFCYLLSQLLTDLQ